MNQNNRGEEKQLTKIREIRELEELAVVCRESTVKPVIIFKHSNSCPISRKAKQEVERYTELTKQNDPAVYQVVVQEARPLSNEIASRLQVVHESPQIIIMQNNQACWNCSHSQITAENLQQAVQRLAGGC